MYICVYTYFVLLHYVGRCWYFIKRFEDVSREFDEFRVNTHLCKLRCWYVLVIHYGSDFLKWEGSYFFVLKTNMYRMFRFLFVCT